MKPDIIAGLLQERWSQGRLQTNAYQRSTTARTQQNNVQVREVSMAQLVSAMNKLETDGTKFDSKLTFSATKNKPRTCAGIWMI